MKLLNKLKDEAQDEAYVYFDRRIRPMTKTHEGKIDVKGSGLFDNDVDAFRHGFFRY